MVFYQDNTMLFHEGDLSSVLRAHYGSVPTKVDAIPRDQFLSTPEDDLVEHIVALMTVNALEIHEDSMEMDQEESKVDVSGDPRRAAYHLGREVHVPGLKVTVTVPFTGDHQLWGFRPSKYRATFPYGNVRRPMPEGGIGYLDIVIDSPSDAGGEHFKKILDETLEGIRFYLEHQRLDIEGGNEGLPNLARQAIQARRKRLEEHDGIAQALDIPLKRRAGAPSVRPIPMQRKLVRPLPPPPKTGFQAEPGILTKDYEHILNIIRHEGRTFETTPATYAVHDEEGLRDIMMAHLNGHYEGSATAETFRGAGKTDIRIEDSERAAFVAECKVWRGSKELTSAIDQLLGYLTWRDCKAALVIFNKKNARFGELLEKVPAALTDHPYRKKELRQEASGEWRYVFRTGEDEYREVTIHVFVFDLHVRRS